MSTITYRDGIMSSDTRAYAGFNLPIGAKKKIRASEDGTLVGCTTHQPGLGEAFLAWICDGADEPESSEYQAIVVKPNGDVYYYRNGNQPSGPLEIDFIAVGSGAEAALGAMWMGATAEDAVGVAANIDVWTGLPVYSLALDDVQPKARPKKKS